MKTFQLQRRKKNCSCSKPWQDYVTIRAKDYEEAVDITVKMNRKNKDFRYKVKR